ncbi:MAG: hypothetical protein HQL32_12650 [Planctomycetes bacterium]|nr:hypothetical protein [Planctomycetota bacterium]
MRNRNLFAFTCLLFLTFAPFALAKSSQLEKAKALCKEAKTLMDKDHRGNAPKTLVILKKARSLLFSLGELSAEDEDLLIKINANIYWQSKFSSAFAISPEEIAQSTSKKSKKGGKGKKTKEIIETKKIVLSQKQKDYQLALREVKKYERKFPKDYYSNLFNYLSLQDKAPGALASEFIMGKTEFYHEAIKDEKKDILLSLKHHLKDYDYFLNHKQYDDLLISLGKCKKKRGLSPKQKSFIKETIKETEAMAVIKNTLIEIGGTIPIPLPSDFKGISGTVTKMTKSKLYFSSEEEGILNSSISWSAVSESGMMEMISETIKGKDTDEIKMLAISNMRMGNFIPAYDYYSKLLNAESTNYVKYRNFLSVCEVGYRLKSGRFIEGKLNEAIQLRKKGKQVEALAEMKKLYENYIESTPLGNCYRDRFQLVFNEIKQNA